MNKSTAIKVYGERNTVTNYLSQLIKLNYNAHEIRGVVPLWVMSLQKLLPGREVVRDIYFDHSYQNNLGWKHMRVNSPEVIRDTKVFRNHRVVFLTVTKNPYAWAMSLHRNPYHQYYRVKPDLEEFLQTPWHTIGRDNIDEKSVKSPIELWNIKNSSYFNLDSFDVVHLTSENLLGDPGLEIDAISAKFSIDRKSSSFVNYQRSTKERQKDNNYYRDYYQNEKWRKNLSARAIEIINEAVDKGLMKRFGYQVLEP